MEERGHLDDLGIDGRVILKWILRHLDARVWTGFMWNRLGTNSWLP
jgi:hypothetical protein